MKHFLFHFFLWNFAFPKKFPFVFIGLLFVVLLIFNFKIWQNILNQKLNLPPKKSSFKLPLVDNKRTPYNNNKNQLFLFCLQNFIEFFTEIVDKNSHAKKTSFLFLIFFFLRISRGRGPKKSFLACCCFRLNNIIADDHLPKIEFCLVGGFFAWKSFCKCAKIVCRAHFPRNFPRPTVHIRGQTFEEQKQSRNGANESLS